MNDVIYSGLTALNAASSGQGEADNLGAFTRIRRERLLAADLNAALGAGLLDLPRALSLLIAFALLEGHVIGTVSRYAGERGLCLRGLLCGLWRLLRGGLDRGGGGWIDRGGRRRHGDDLRQ
jgi:hypothetical protein